MYVCVYGFLDKCGLCRRCYSHIICTVHDAAGSRITFSSFLERLLLNEGLKRGVFTFANAALGTKVLRWNAPHWQTPPRQVSPGLKFLISQLNQCSNIA